MTNGQKYKRAIYVYEVFFWQSLSFYKIQNLNFSKKKKCKTAFNQSSQKKCPVDNIKILAQTKSNSCKSLIVTGLNKNGKICAVSQQ